MEKMPLGGTGLVVSRDGFGALPIQRVGLDEAVEILHAALDAGISFYDTARAYSDSEAKLGTAFAGRRQQVVLATKSTAKTGEGLVRDLETSLAELKTDYVDLLQLHNAAICPTPGDGTGLYEALAAAQKQGRVRAIGITSHRLDVATAAVESGLYQTLQFPFSYLSSPADQQLVRLCAEKGMGFIAMKALSGGLLDDIAAARAWMMDFGDVIPIWGIQRMSEIKALAQAIAENLPLGPAQLARVRADRDALAGEFCRGCGYCMPCPANIEINSCARVMLMSRRLPSDFFSAEWQARMARVDNCIGCKKCSAKCPYGLDTPALLRQNRAEYLQALAAQQPGEGAPS